MKLRNLDFENDVFGQSGVSGFYGEGDEYPHHAYFKHIPGFSFNGMSFVAKTITADPRIYPYQSNTPLDEYRLQDMFPKSIWWSVWSFLNGYMLNAMGLPNEGATGAFARHKWNKRNDTFQLSFMPMGKTLKEKLDETKAFADAVYSSMSSRKNFAIQLNLSCPNTEHGKTQDVGDAIAILSLLRARFPDVPLIPKFDLLIEPESVHLLKPYCDAFCIGNSLPFGKLQPLTWWKKLFPNGSPLPKALAKEYKEKTGKEKDFSGFPGGLSGAPLFPLLVQWLRRMDHYDPSVIIIAGGGIMKKKHIQKLLEFDCVHGIALGAVATLRPWRLQSLINYGNKIFSTKKIKA